LIRETKSLVGGSLDAGLSLGLRSDFDCECLGFDGAMFSESGRVLPVGAKSGTDAEDWRSRLDDFSGSGFFGEGCLGAGIEED
jgi:hypothetical protein